MLKKKREQGIRKNIGEANIALQDLEKKLADSRRQQQNVLDNWQKQHIAQGQMTHEELTTWVKTLQRLQNQYADMGRQCLALEKNIAECHEELASLQNELRLAITSQEKLNYMIHEQEG
ncbi:hypothetical protein L8P27_05060 [Enterobacter asburiae]|uniref:hypothetical protein n=1 Tax=Enterobacter asburiae TaxID=61645 RepID=UPI002003E1F1|nr:hypothetical protein [Enterobacter asburiae]MCK7227221.1 hypothetical protein [Enterobacter asburiae]